MKKFIFSITLLFSTLFIFTTISYAQDDPLIALQELKIENIFLSNAPVNMDSNFLTSYVYLDLDYYRDYDFLVIDLSPVIAVQTLQLEGVMEESVIRGTNITLYNTSGVQLTKLYDIFDNNYQYVYEISDSVGSIRINLEYLVDQPQMSEMQRLQQQGELVGFWAQYVLNKTYYPITAYKSGTIIDSDNFYLLLKSYIDNYKLGLESQFIAREAKGYAKGYSDGINVDNNASYQEGFKAGSKDGFESNIHVWIVPAILVVIVLGGIVSFIATRRGE